MVGTAAAIASLVGGLASAGGSIAQGVMGSNAAHDAANAQATAAEKANAGISTAASKIAGINEQNQELLKPYTSAGTTTLAQILAGLQPGGQFNREFTASDMEKYDPGYQFRLQQGQQAIERSAAARGTQLSGGTLRDLTDYQQGAASAEYQNAFNRYMAQIQQTYGIMSGVTNLGLSATNSAIQGNQWQGGTELQAAEAMGQNLVGAGNAKSAGIIGGNNALWGGITGAINTVGKVGTMLAQPETTAAAATSAAAAPTVAAPTTPAANGTSYIRPQVVNPYTMPLFLGQVMRPQAA